MAATHRNRLVTAISNTPGGAGALTISTAASGYRTFGASDDGLSFDVSIVDGTAWEIRTGCVYTHAGTSLARGTLEDSSTGSAITLTSAAVVTVTMSAGMGNFVENQLRGYLSGMSISYSSATAFAVSSGVVDLNGTQREYTGATYTSASTMKDMANSTVTLGANKGYTIFAYNNAGTVEIRIEDRDGTGDGAACTFDESLDYFKAATTGAEARKIGVIWTNGSSQFYKFQYTGPARNRRMMTVQGAALVTNGTAASFTSVTTTPYVQTDDGGMWVGVGNRRIGTAGTAQVLLTFDGGTDNSINLKVYHATASNTASLGSQFMPNSGTLHYTIIGGSADASVGLCGLEMFV